MVVKLLNLISKGLWGKNAAYDQVHEPEHLRIIYGPDYLRQENLDLYSLAPDVLKKM